MEIHIKIEDFDGMEHDGIIVSKDDLEALFAKVAKDVEYDKPISAKRTRAREDEFIIEKLREGLTMKEVAAAIGRHPSTISKRLKKMSKS